MSTATTWRESAMDNGTGSPRCSPSRVPWRRSRGLPARLAGGSSASRNGRSPARRNMSSLSAAERGRSRSTSTSILSPAVPTSRRYERALRRGAVRAARRRGSGSRPYRAAADDQLRPRQLRPGRHPCAPSGRGLRRSCRSSPRRAHARRYARQGGQGELRTATLFTAAAGCRPPATPIPPKSRSGESGSRWTEGLQARS